MKKITVENVESLLKEARQKVEQMEKGSVFVTDQGAQQLLERLITVIEILDSENKNQASVGDHHISEDAIPFAVSFSKARQKNKTEVPSQN